MTWMFEGREIKAPTKREAIRILEGGKPIPCAWFKKPELASKYQDKLLTTEEYYRTFKK